MFDRLFEWVVAAFLAVVLPTGDYMLLMLGTVGLDSLFKVLSLAKTKERFSLKKLLWDGIVLKVFVYGWFIVFLFWVDEILIDSIIHENHLFTKIAILITLTNEIRSVSRHFLAIVGVDVSSNLSFLNKVIKQVRELVKNIKG